MMATKPKLETVEDRLAEIDEARRAANVHRKLAEARRLFHTLELKKSGKNTFAGYDYFELGDFLIPGMDCFYEVGLGHKISFTADLATMTITNLDDPTDETVITSPMGGAALKGCHEVQNIGAVETYQRRYLWQAALEIVEHDALDATTGKAPPEAKANHGGFITQAQFDQLEKIRVKTDITAARFCKRFEVEAMAQLPAAKFEEAKAALENKIKEPA